MVKGTSWESSSVYRAGWKGSDGIVKAQEVSYTAMYQVPNPGAFKQHVKKRVKSMLNVLLDEEEAEESSETFKNCLSKGLNVFVNRKG